MLFHSRGCGSLFETATPAFITKSRSSLIGFLNVPESYLVLFTSFDKSSWGQKAFRKTKRNTQTLMANDIYAVEQKSDRYWFKKTSKK